MPNSKVRKIEKKPVWQKRVKKGIIPEAAKFMDSTIDDRYLVEYDILCSITHAEMLKRQRIISASEFSKIRDGLKRILNEYKKGKIKLAAELEDVHMNIEFQLKKRIGLIAEKLHTARSRNDLIATELRMYCRDKTKALLKGITGVQKAILNQAIKNKGVIIPGYTHLQQAQPVLVSFYLASYFYKFQRDFEQLAMLNKWVNISPLGSCALGGTSIPIDRKFLAKRLGFARICENALDGVSDRDFLIDILYHIARLMVHISNLATDLIIFSTKEFSLVEFDDSIVTGSSIMPQKKNPDVCELLRAKSGKAIGNLLSGLSILKGLTFSYNRDLQELKGLLFTQIEECIESLDVLTLLIEKTHFKTPSDRWQKVPDFICATDLVEFFVKKGYRFRHIYNLIAECIKNSDGGIDKFIILLSKKTKVGPEMIRENMTPLSSVKTKNSEGSTGLKATKATLKLMNKLLVKNQRETKL